MMATFNRIAALKEKANAATLAEGISDSLIWVIVGTLFFWPGVLFVCIGFWKKYITRSANQDDTHDA